MEKSDLKRLAKIEDILYGYAEEYGLKICDIEWDIIADQKMFEIMAYRIPGNVSNWKFGRDYEKIRTMNEKVRAGLPYEVVINSDPARAYLMKSNTFGVQMLVMAHVIGHVAFFTMNKYFQKTNKDIIQIMDLASKRFHKYERAYGIDDVERVIDAAHALQFHSSPFEDETEAEKKKRVFKMKKKQAHKVSTAEYNDLTVGSDIDESVKGDIQRFNQKLWRAIQQKTPIEPSGDLLRYIIDYSHNLEDWEQDICEILRKEGQYFWPQMKTKFMNEGFASYWHITMMNRLYNEGHINETEHAEFVYSNSLVLAQNKFSMNPYLIGYKVWKNIVERYDKGQHGDEYDRLKLIKDKEEWDTEAGGGHEKMLNVARTYQDWFFMMEFLTPELVEDLNLYIYAIQDTPEQVQVVRTKHNAKQIAKLIISSFADSHIPNVQILDLNYEDAGKMLLEHKHTGAELQVDFAKKTMAHIRTLWRRDCVLKCIVSKKPTKITATKTGITVKEYDPDKGEKDIGIIPI
jgi:stage V sporulation protein R